MARAPDDKTNEAYKLYKEGYSLVDIANKLDKPAGTIRRWKHSYDWDGEKKISERSQKKGKKKNERTKKENARNKKIDKVVADEVKEVMSNTELNDKQRLFCLYYVQSFNGTKSYLKAYGCDEYAARVNASRLLTKDNIRKEILKLKANRLTREFISEEDIFQKYMDIAYANINDYVKVNGMFVQAKDEIDGTIVSEITATPNGIKIKLADRMKALDWITSHMNMATAEQKAKIELMQAQIDNLNKDKDNSEDGVTIVNDIPKPN